MVGTMAGRNDPCPCGSGKKYKKCCMLADQARRDQTTPRLINRASEEAAQALMAYARHTRGDRFLEDVWAAAWPSGPFDRDSPFNVLIIPWALYLWDAADDVADSGTVAAEFLAAATRIDSRTRRFIEACQTEPLAFWQAQAVEPGVGMTVRNMATGKECFVHERSATQTIVAWDVVFAQIVDIDGVHTLSISGPYALPAERFRRRVEQFLAEEIDPERLSDHNEDLLGFYLACMDDLLHPQMPKLANTEGDPLEWTTSTYRFAPDQRGRLLGRLDQMRNIEADPVEDEDKAEYTWISQRRDGPLEQVSRGRLAVAADTLVTECNSRKRDRLLRERLGKSLSELLQHEGTTHKELDWDAVKAAGERPPAGAIDPATLPPEVRQQMQQMMDDMHMRWADERVPALGNRTPREAVKTPEGRREVAEMVNDYENMCARNPQNTFDFNRLRRELGLEVE
ncbi:MAG: SEC-C domain-containing protein [Dehalococcoidia bacterium]|nr:SEC-C domain-containing protein [Dehalococcoidia bacterium]